MNSRNPRAPAVQRAWKRHAHQAGEIMTAWNDLQAGLFLVFWGLVSPDHPQGRSIALAIWHSFASDNNQRELLLSVASVALAYDKSKKRLPATDRHKARIHAQIKWLKKQADKLSTYRNDPVHVPVTFGIEDDGRATAIPNLFVAKAIMADRLREKPLEKIWRLVRGDLTALALFAEELSVAIDPKNGRPLPRRPRLLTFQASSPQKNRKSRRREKSSRPPLPSP